MHPAKANNSQRDQDNRENMGLPQRSERSFRWNNYEHNQDDRESLGRCEQFDSSFERTWEQILSSGLLGFGSMNLAIWEQIFLMFAMASPNGGTDGILVAFIVVATLYGFTNKNLADMARDYPTYAGPFHYFEH